MSSTTPLHRPHLTDVPPLPPTARNAPARLPAPLTPLVGRERELATVLALLLPERAATSPRLITLTGPGGVGKTRLALRLAADLEAIGHFTDGVVFVELVTVRDPDQVAPAIAQSLSLRLSPREPAFAMLTTHLRTQNLLLILDNFEQVIEAGTRIAELLRACPGLKVLVTSRSLLQVSGECTVVVPPLSLPSQTLAEASDHASSEAVRLFIERARSTGADVTLTAANAPTVTEICRRLDGLPLAIELAAARSALFPPAALLRRLEQRLPHLTSGPSDVPARHQTMRDAIAWSYDLLPAAEQTVFRRLAVFVGGCTLDAAESVCGSIVAEIESLVHQSLLSVVEVPNGDPPSPRVVMLETVREFALERLVASGEEETVLKAHANWCLSLAEEADVAYRTRSGHARWLTRLQTEHANFRAALNWQRDAGETELSLQLAGALAGFWYFRGHFSEGRTWLTQALARHQGGPPAMRARALQSAGMLAHYQGDDRVGLPLLEEGLSLWRAAGDRWGTAGCLSVLGVVAEDRGDYDEAEPLLEESLALFSTGSYPLWAAHMRCHLGIVALGKGELNRAAALGEQACREFREQGDAWGTVMSLDFLGLVAIETGDPVRAATCFAEALPVVRELRLPESLLRCLAGVATLAATTGRPHEAARLFGAVATLAEVIGSAFDLPERAFYERATAMIRERLDEQDFAAAWAAGRKLAREEAVAEALELATAPLTATRPSLTSRETEVLRLLATEMPDAAIAATLFLSVRTVENHVARILAKLGVRSRADAVATARTTGLL